MQAPKLAKRKLALHLGYVGTDFRGLQLQPSVTPDASVEAALVRALHAAGCILESNMGSLARIKWSRSSRTDKGVHSLATVVAAKLEIDDAAFAADGEGMAVAAAVNAHLPREVRVLSAQRVNNAFNAREKCDKRSYLYYLPASLLGWVGDGRGEDGRRLALFREALAAFQGTHAFHNYTQRKRYRPGEHQPRRGSKGGRGRAAPQYADEDDEVSASGGEEDVWPGDQAEDGPYAPAGRAPKRALEGEGAPGRGASEPQGGGAGEGAKRRLVSGTGDGEQGGEATAAPMDCDGPGGAAGEAVGGDAESAQRPQQRQGEGAREAGHRRRGEGGGERRLWHIPLQWAGEKDMQDLITGVHHRTMHEVSAAGDPEPLVPQGPPCLRVTIYGQSFLLHQIRHMLGSAICVARGIFPLEWLKASICVPARTVCNLVPSEGLVLADALFYPFAHSTPGQDPVGELTGDRLRLREAGLAARDAFDREVLQPHMSGLLEAEVWGKWVGNLERMAWEAADMEAFLAAYRGYMEKEPERIERRARLAEQKKAGKRPRPPGAKPRAGAEAEP